MGVVRVEVLDAVAVVVDQGRVSGADLGGRRCRVLLVALALHDQPVPAGRLAEIVWAGHPPVTWAAALRNVVRDLRLALGPIGLGDQLLVRTGSTGYSLAAHVDDIHSAHDDVAAAAAAVAALRPDRAVDLAEPASRMRGADLLPGEDAAWIESHRRALDLLRRRALEVIVVAAGIRGDHHRAIGAAHALIDDDPIDERGYRLLMKALDGAGDRAGVTQAYERCRSALAEQLGIDPSSETVEQYLTALRSHTPPPGGALPTAGGSFFGRDDEKRWLQDALTAPGAIALLGRGGVGKSRLALEFATAARRTQQVRWVGLGSVNDDDLVAGHVALELGADPGGAPAPAVVDRLAPLGPTVLVLDACEGVIDGVVGLVSELLAGCPSLTVVATSRIELRIDNARSVVLGPLDPSTSAALIRVRAAEGGRQLPEDHTSRRLLEQIAGRCAGLPLALEIIAAQLLDMSLADAADELPIADEIDQLGSLLRRSYALLEPAEARLWRRMSAFGGPVGLPLVRAVVDDDLPPLRVTRMLRELAAAGLISVDRTQPRWRYQMDDDVRRLAAGLLADAGEEELTYRRIFLALVALLPDDARAAPGPFAADVTAVIGTVRAVFSACLRGVLDRNAGLELAFRLHRYWAATAVAEGRFWLDRLLADVDGTTAGADRWAALATFAHGYLVYWAGDAATATPLLATAVQRLRGVDDSFAARSLIYLAGLTDDLDRPDEALAAIREATLVARTLGDRALYVGAAMGVAAVLAERGDPAAVGAATDALRVCREIGNADQLAGTLPTAAMICWQVGDVEGARDLAAEARLLLPPGARIARVVLLSVSSGICLADNDLAGAIEYGRAADAEGTGLGVDRELPLLRCLLARALHATGSVDAARDRTAAALSAAAALSYDGPAALALETAAIVLDGAVPAVEMAGLTRTAAAIRRRGRRPLPPLLVAAPKPAAGEQTDGGDADSDRAAAIAVALKLLSG